MVHPYTECTTAVQCSELPQNVFNPYNAPSLPQPRPVVAMLLDAADVVTVAEHLKQTEIPQKPIWLIGRLTRGCINI